MILPPELRFQIYGHLIPGPRTINVVSMDVAIIAGDGSVKTYPRVDMTTTVPLLAQICAETRQFPKDSKTYQLLFGAPRK